MEYRFSKDPLFGKYCYIDTPWIAGKNTIYRIVNSGVRSNAWVEVPIRGREEVVLHDYQEDVIFVVLDTLISEDSKIKKVALKDVEIADTPQPNCSEKPNNCEYAENPSGDAWECGCFLDTYCEHQIYDRNPDGTINIVECGYEPKDEPKTDCETCRYADGCDWEPWQECPYTPKDEPTPQEYENGYSKSHRKGASDEFRG